MPEPLVPANVVKKCLDAPTVAAWQDFVQCFQRDIARSVSAVLRLYRRYDPALVDDLTQETFCTLCKDQCEVLVTIRDFDDAGIRAYIRRIAENTAREWFRSQSAAKRGAGAEPRSLDPDSAAAAAAPTLERETLLGQIRQIVARVAQSDRDRDIFCRYYTQGFSAAEISGLPNIDLSPERC